MSVGKATRTKPSRCISASRLATLSKGPIVASNWILLPRLAIQKPERPASVGTALIVPRDGAAAPPVEGSSPGGVGRTGSVTRQHEQYRGPGGTFFLALPTNVDPWRGPATIAASGPAG